MKTTPTSQPPYGPYISTRRPLSRRHFLRGTGVALSLPFLDAMLPTFTRAQQSSNPMAPNAKPRRMFAIITNLGLVPKAYEPLTAGRDYKASPYLEVLAEHRNDLTVFSGVSLPNVGGSHPTQDAWLTGAPNPGSSSFKNTISLDQVVAEAIGVQTRFPSLALAVNGQSLSWTGSGVRIPAEQSPAEVYKQLFVQGSQKEVEAQVLKLKTGQSILDTIAGQVKDLERDVGTPDRERIDQFVTSVRDLESRLKVNAGWEQKPKPVISTPAPTDEASSTKFIEKIKLMYDLARLVFETDSTRAVTLFCDAAATGVVDSPLGTAITEGYHGLSHHGKSEEKLAQMRALEVGQLKKLNDLLSGLKSVKEDGEALLDRTMVLFGSNLSDGNSHVTLNLPCIFAGGGFKHGQHLQFDNVRNYPLTNLHLSMLHRMGINKDKFSSSTGTMRGLEMT
jgi:hypothetical protein